MKPKDERIRLVPGESFRLLQWTDNLQAVTVLAADGTSTVSAGAGHEWHHHPQMELTLIEQGSGTLFIGDAITPFRAPDLVMIGHDLPHYWHMRQPSAGFALQFGFSAEHPFWQFPETAALRSLWEDAQRGVRLYGAAVQNISGLIREAAVQGGMGRLALFMRIMAEISTVAPRDRPPLASATFALPTSQSAYRGLQKAINLIFNRFAEDLTFDAVLREAGMSKATFERHFKRHTGRHFTRFLAEVRLNAAARQLTDTDLTVSEIALAAGYGNLSYFHRQFRDLFGCSPLSFRRKVKPD